MRLKRIELENFKGVGKRQVIELAPITLLFGANSAGKSTILQALHYVREILERGNLDPDITATGGILNLGGFKTLIHNHDLNREIGIKLTIEMDRSDAIFNSSFVILANEFDHLKNKVLGWEFPVRIVLDKEFPFLNVDFEIRIGWDDSKKSPIVTRLAVEWDDNNKAVLEGLPGGNRAHLSELNFENFSLHRFDFDNPENGGWFVQSEKNIRIDQLSRDFFFRHLREGQENGSQLIETKNILDQIKVINNMFTLADLSLSNVNKDNFSTVGIMMFLSDAIFGPIRYIRNHLNNMTYIGPLREIPSRFYRPQTSPDESRWANGLASWDLLYGDHDTELTEATNKWLSDVTCLNTGYCLDRTIVKEVSFSSPFHNLFVRGLKEDELDVLKKYFDALPQRVDVGLRDLTNDVFVKPQDIGVGISQLVPVVVALLRARIEILSIEQPELHLHPAVQVGIGDLLIEASDRTLADGEEISKTLLIETHSEHILLRLLRRLRETTDDELPPDVKGLKPEDLSVIYVEKTDYGVFFKRLEVDETGEFKDQWPGGFFEERAEELF